MIKPVQLGSLVLATALVIVACKPADSGTSAGAAQAGSTSNAVPSVPTTSSAGQADTAKKQ